MTTTTPRTLAAGLLSVAFSLGLACSERVDLTAVPSDSGADAAVESGADAGVDVSPAPAMLSLSISAGSLVPAFDPAVTTYQVLPSVSSLGVPLTVTPTAPAGYTLKVDGAALASGTASAPISLALESPTVVDVTFAAPSSSPVHYVLTVPPQQEAYVKASNTTVTPGGARFGRAIAIDADTLVVGAPNESSGGSGVDGSQDAGTAPASGAVYVFNRTGGAWQQTAYLKASNPHPNDAFGISVALSGDTLAVGATGESSKATGIGGDQGDTSATSAGAVYVFTRAGTTWTQQAYVKASNTRAGAQFGWSVALEGDTLAVTAEYEDSAAKGIGGNQADTSASQAGAAYVFARSGATWSQEAYVKASNTYPGLVFGYSCALSGDTLVVGALNEKSGSPGINGDQSDTSASAAGAAYVFRRSGSAWSQEAYVKASNPRALAFFGYSIAIDHDTMAIGSVRETSGATGIDGNQSDTSADTAGAAYVFSRAGSTWTQQAYVKASNTKSDQAFGSSVAIRGDVLAVGAMREHGKASGINGDQSDTSIQWAGAAYVFGRVGTTWTQHAYVKASNPANDTELGQTIALTDTTLVVGGHHEPSAASGVNGNQTDVSIPGAGAVYVLR